MGVFSWFSRKEEQKAPVAMPQGSWFQFVDTSEAKMTSAELYAELFSGTDSTTGIRISWENALQLSAVMACVRVLGNGVAQVPFVLHRREGKMTKRAVNLPLYSLTHDMPSEYMTSFTMRFAMMMHLALTGDAFVWINRVRGQVAELLLLTPGSVTIQRDGWDVQYLVTGESGKQYTLSKEDVWHVRAMSWNGVVGLDPVKLARNILGLSMATEEYGSKFFKNGGRPSGLLTTPASLNEEQRKGLRSDWEFMNAGIQNANRVAVIWGGLTFTPLSTNNDQGQFLETRQFQIEEVCRVFGVNPIMIYRSDKAATYASAEQMFLSHVTNTLMPWYANFEQSAAMSLLTEEERRSGLYFKLMANGLMRGAAADRAEFYNKGRIGGWLTINEIREFEELNPVEGGDDPFAPLNSNVSGAAKPADTSEDGEEEDGSEESV